MRGACRHEEGDGVCRPLAVTTYTACDPWRMLYPPGNATADAANACNEANLCLLQGVVVRESVAVLCVGCQ